MDAGVAYVISKVSLAVTVVCSSKWRHEAFIQLDEDDGADID
jgi:hypothetical protein